MKKCDNCGKSFEEKELLHHGCLEPNGEIYEWYGCKECTSCRKCGAYLGNKCQCVTLCWKCSIEDAEMHTPAEEVKGGDGAC